MQLFKEYAKNTRGTDYGIGDLHGHFSLLEEALRKIHFDKTKDRLFSVGDLIDRGPSSDRVDEFTWIEAVRGNHEQMLLENNWNDEGRVQNGAAWWICLPNQEKVDLRLLFGSRPIAIQVETDAGLLGIVHAEVPYYDWSKFRNALCDWDKYLVNCAIWDRSRWVNNHDTVVKGVDHVIVGHTSRTNVGKLGNVINLDTGCGYDGGRLTVMNLNTLEVAIQLYCPDRKPDVVFPEPWGR